ncbi:MAG: multicopper oxidase domain-containing protein, partial [Acidimicrobiales bacterium]|nr:multicopper oxidase domain-containing protein [Acidimicrobiales bacterium]
MTIIDEQPVSGPAPAPRRPSSVPVRMEKGETLGTAWILAFVLGAMAIGMIGFVSLIIFASSTSDSGSSVPQTTLEVNLREFSIDGDLVAPAGEVTLVMENTGSMDHNLGVRELGVISPNVGPGGTVQLALGELAPGTYEVFCSIAGHEASGMVTSLTVTGEGEGTPAASAAGGHGGIDMDFAAMDAAMMESMLAFPAETEGKGNPILEPTEVRPDGTKVFDLTAEIVDWEVEPGKFVEAWTYNGVVPAPQIVLDRGDDIEVRVVNNLPLGTDIHWHGVHTPNDQDGVAPYT